MKNYKYFSIITGLFAACLVISNILDTKFFHIGQTAFPSGIILFPIVYVFGDIFTEVYGYAQSRKAIWTGFFSLLIMVVFFEIGRRLPAAPFWEQQDAFDAILGKVPRIVVASITAYFMGEFSNSFTYYKLLNRKYFTNWLHEKTLGHEIFSGSEVPFRNPGRYAKNRGIL